MLKRILTSDSFEEFSEPMDAFVKLIVGMNEAVAKGEKSTNTLTTQSININEHINTADYVLYGTVDASHDIEFELKFFYTHQAMNLSGEVSNMKNFKIFECKYLDYLVCYLLCSHNFVFLFS